MGNIKCFSELRYGQLITVAPEREPMSTYVGHKALFEGMSTLFGEDVAIVNYIDPKPLAYDGTPVLSDMLYLSEIEVNGASKAECRRDL